MWISRWTITCITPGLSTGVTSHLLNPTVLSKWLRLDYIYRHTFQDCADLTSHITNEEERMWQKPNTLKHLWADVRRFLWAEIKQRDTSTVFVIHSSAVCDSVARGVMKAKRCESALRPQVSETSGRWIERVFLNLCLKRKNDQVKQMCQASLCKQPIYYSIHWSWTSLSAVKPRFILRYILCLRHRSHDGRTQQVLLKHKVWCFCAAWKRHPALCLRSQRKLLTRFSKKTGT